MRAAPCAASAHYGHGECVYVCVLSRRVAGWLARDVKDGESTRRRRREWRRSAGEVKRKTVRVRSVFAADVGMGGWAPSGTLTDLFEVLMLGVLSTYFIHKVHR